MMALTLCLTINQLGSLILLAIEYHLLTNTFWQYTSIFHCCWLIQIFLLSLFIHSQKKVLHIRRPNAIFCCLQSEMKNKEHTITMVDFNNKVPKVWLIRREKFCVAWYWNSRNEMHYFRVLTETLQHGVSWELHSILLNVPGTFFLSTFQDHPLAEITWLLWCVHLHVFSPWNWALI